MRYDRLRSVAGRIQTVVGDMATQGERFQGTAELERPKSKQPLCNFLPHCSSSAVCDTLQNSCFGCGLDLATTS
ncbi:hypothetical protein Patl1_01382 [Pistacia atlantica]|uniref:Uncharacterized protein n=1 Tax=Pistacia atlantica TaxID=434234 RepID=A0ACC1C3Y2_9ROSI|nr:hypothetical protein Patl1_01382 [Pistacia atlantica]